MPRVEVRKARKDYPQQGIKKGDTYYWTKLKLQRGGIEKRSLTPFKPSQLTNSPFKGGWLAMQESWNEGDKDADAIRSAAESIRELGEDAQASFDNMPEGLQQGDTGQTLENRASTCEDVADQLDELADELEGLEDPGEEPEEPEEVPEPLGDLETEEENDMARAEYDAYQESLTEWQEWHDNHATYEAEVDRITEEADGLIGDMPE